MYIAAELGTAAAITALGGIDGANVYLADRARLTPMCIVAERQRSCGGYHSIATSRCSCQ